MLQVKRSLVDGIRDSQIDQLAENKTIIATLEQFTGVHIQW
jgi:hypothetical protein